MTRTKSGIRRGLLAGASSLALLAGLSIGAPVAVGATTILVNTGDQQINGDGLCSLQEAIYAANLDDNIAPDPSDPTLFVDTACPAGSGHDVIELPPLGVFQFADPIDDIANFMGPTVTPIITSDITIEGRGARLERLAAGRLTRAFAVGQTGFLDLREVHLKGFAVRGGHGNDGGGGGMGAGGAIYVQGGQLLVQWSTFEGNAATGGNGGFKDTSAGGGGGGLSGDGGPGINQGGGGGGSRGDGDRGDSGGGDLGGGGGGTLTSAVGNAGGDACGADGGRNESLTGADDGEDATGCPGGGGGGGTDRQVPFDAFCGGEGGQGGYGGGGGGGGTSGSGGNGGFGGGAGGWGGNGGFGGGGGAYLSCGPFENFGQGGTFAGDAGSFAGGGGAGLGGAIFGYLADIEISNSTFAGNMAKWGLTADAGANNGRGAGGAIFTVAGDLTVESSTLALNEAVTVTGGGGGGIVVYDPIGTDEATLVLRNTIIAGNGLSECYTRNGVDTGGSDGNIITHNGVSSTPDAVACVGVDASSNPGLGALALNAPGRTPTMAIGPTSLAINAAVGTVPLDDQRGVARPQGAGADIGAYEYEAPAALAPVSSITLTPAAPNGSNGWYTSPVGVSVTAFDFDGDLAQTRCALDPAATPASFVDLPDLACALTSVGADGEHAIHAASTDLAGNAETPVVSATFKLDGTAPALQPTLNVAVVRVGQTGVVASPNASDATSGVASSSCDPVDTSAVGVNTVSCNAADNAGNTATTLLTYVVEYRILGFFSPTPQSKWRAGQTVPIKIALGDAAGNPISDAAAAALVAACRVTFAATGVQSTSGNCLKYDAGMDQLQFNWKLRKSPLGADTLAVSVSYPGSSVRTTLSVSILIIK